MIIKRRYKKFISIILVIAMLITNLAGCGKNGQSTTQNQGSISTVSDAQIYDFENTVHEDKTTSVLTQEEIDKIESVSAKIDESGEDISSLLESIASGNSYTEENIEKIGAALDSSEESVEDWIELQSELYISVSDDLSEEAAELLKNRQDEEALKLHESIETAEAKYTELMAAYESGDKEKISEMTEELTEMFNGEIPSYGSEESRTVSKNINYDKIIQNLISPKVSSLIDDSDEVREYFKYEFETPLEAYEYIKNNVYTEFYYGRKKTVLGTYESCSGNDYDQAVLLASILDSMGYETKYVRGNILLTPEMALSMTGADNVEIAANIISMAGVPTTKLLAKDGNIKSIKIEHVWVRAEIPYTDYRGAGNASGDMVWVDLDTSIKFYEKVDNIYDYLDNVEVYSNLKTTFNNDGFDKGYNLLKTTTESSAQKIRDEKKNLYNRRRIVKKETINYLPLSLQYEVKDELEVSENIDIGDSISISVSAEDLGTYSAAYLSDKSVVIAFDPASREDAEIVNAYGSIFEVSANSVYVKPVLYIDGVKVAEAEYTEYTLGTPTKIRMTLSYAGNQTSNNKYIENNAIAGSTYALTIDASEISHYELQDSYKRLYSKKNTISESNVLSTDNIGELLAYTGKLYFAQLDAMDTVASEAADVVDIRRLSEAVTGYEVDRKMFYGIITKLDYGSLFIDIDSDDHAVLSRDGDKNKEVLFRYHVGSLGSMCEGLIWTESRNSNRDKSVSSISILEKARESGIEIVMLEQKDINNLSFLDNLELDQSVKNDIKSDLISGNIITIPKENVRIGQWKGSGYISINPDTGEGTYKISGGLSGGVDPFKATAATCMAVFACYFEYLSATLVCNAIINLSIPGFIGGALTLGGLILVAVGFTCLQFMMCAYVEYLLYGGEDRFDSFIQWFFASTFISEFQIHYAMFLIMAEQMYQMCGYKEEAPIDELSKENEKKELSGEWKEVNESMSDFSRAYQKQITGQEGKAFVQNGVKFDGMKDGVLLDAKGKYSQFINKNTGEFYNWFRGKDDLIAEANRQIKASEGAKIQWYFAEEDSLNVVQDLFDDNGIVGIELIYEAAK